MTAPLDDETQVTLDAIRREMVAIKGQTRGLGRDYHLAQSLLLLTDLLEVLLRERHTHADDSDHRR